jgi:hypothetical protein
MGLRSQPRRIARIVRRSRPPACGPLPQCANVVACREDEVTAWIASKIQDVRNAAGDPILA